MFCQFYQGLCPLVSNSTQFCFSPYFIYTFYTKFNNIHRQWSLLQNHHSTHRIYLSINVFILWKIFSMFFRNVLYPRFKRHKSIFIIAKCKWFLGILVITPFKCSCIMCCPPNINSYNQIFFCNYLCPIHNLA